MTEIIVFGAFVWGALLGMTIVLLIKAGKVDEEERSHSLVAIVKEHLLVGGDYAAHYSKKGFFHFLRTSLISVTQGYRMVKKGLARHHRSLVHYIDGKDVLDKRQAASLYMKNISVHKDDAKKKGTGHIAE